MSSSLGTPLTVAHQAPLSMRFSRQEYWSGLPFNSSWDLPGPGIEPRSPALQADSLPSEPLGNPLFNLSLTAVARSLNVCQTLIHVTRGRYYYHSHFTAEETETKRICSSHTASKWKSFNLNLSSWATESMTFNYYAHLPIKATNYILIWLWRIFSYPIGILASFLWQHLGMPVIGSIWLQVVFFFFNF